MNTNLNILILVFLIARNKKFYTNILKLKNKIKTILIKKPVFFSSPFFFFF